MFKCLKQSQNMTAVITDCDFTVALEKSYPLIIYISIIVTLSVDVTFYSLFCFFFFFSVCICPPLQSLRFWRSILFFEATVWWNTAENARAPPMVTLYDDHRIWCMEATIDSSPFFFDNNHPSVLLVKIELRKYFRKVSAFTNEQKAAG